LSYQASTVLLVKDDAVPRLRWRRLALLGVPFVVFMGAFLLSRMRGEWSLSIVITMLISGAVLCAVVGAAVRESKRTESAQPEQTRDER